MDKYKENIYGKDVEVFVNGKYLFNIIIKGCNEYIKSLVREIKLEIFLNGKYFGEKIPLHKLKVEFIRMVYDEEFDCFTYLVYNEEGKFIKII